MSSATAWYAARGAGIAAYALVTATVLLGLLLSGRRLPLLPRFALEDVHRFVGLLTGVFLAIHVAGIALDTVVPFSLPQLVVPFTAPYRPLWTGAGVIALELFVALAIVNRLRTRISYRVWRRLHGASFAVWTLATLHGVLAGTDRGAAWAQLLYGAAAAAVLLAVTVRVLRGGHLTPALVLGGVLGAGATTVVLALSVIPLAPADGRPAGIAATDVPQRLSGPLSASIDQRDGADAVLVSITGKAGSDGRAAVRIDLLETRESIETSLQLRFPTGAACTGTVSAIDRSGFSGACTTPGGAERLVDGSWQVTGSDVAGTIDVTTTLAG